MLSEFLLLLLEFREGEKKPEKTWRTDTQQYDFFYVLGPNKWLSRTLFFLNHSAGSRFAELGERFSSSKNVGRTPVNQLELLEDQTLLQNVF